MGLRTLLRSFAGGEVAPAMYGRVDDGKYQTGVARARNMIITPQGTAFRRPGTAFVDVAPGLSRLIEFVYSRTQQVVVGLSAGVCRFYLQGAPVVFAVPANYKPSVYFDHATPPNTTTDTITTTLAHGLTSGDPIVFTVQNGATLPTTTPTQIVTETVYYANVTGASTFKLALTAADAIAGTNLLDLTAAGTETTSGDRRVHYGYEVGDLVTYTVGPTTHYYYCKQLPYLTYLGENPSSTDYWYQEPDDRTYEVPTPYAEADLFELTFTQSNDVLTICHEDYPAAELRRYGATRWTLIDIEFAPTIAAPTGLGVAATYGDLKGISTIAVVSSLVEITTRSTHGLLVNDPVYINFGTGTSLVEGFYLVNSLPGTTGTKLTIKSVLYGIPVTTFTGSHTANSGHIRYASLSSEGGNTYVVTAVDKQGVESQPSSSAYSSNMLFVDGAYNVLTWTAVDGAALYRVYKELDGLYGWIGDVDDTTFRDDDIEPKLSITPGSLDVELSASNPPGAVGHYQQRRVFAATAAQGQDVWLTRTNTESDLTYHLPVQDDDRIYVRLATQSRAAIQHVVDAGDLLLFTDASIIRANPENVDGITPATFTQRKLAAVGTTKVRPQLVNASVLFADSRGGHVRELGVSPAAGQYVVGDLSIRANHLFDTLDIVDSAQQRAPWPVTWFVSSNGKLLGLTNVAEEQVAAWHWHDTDGLIKSSAVIAEGDEDRLYLCVERTIDGSTVHYIERLGEQKSAAECTSLAAAFHVDAGMTYSGAEATTISGLGHLEGEVVQVLADGYVEDNETVTSGQITIGTASTVVTVGLPFTSQLLQLPFSAPLMEFAQSMSKRITRATVRVLDSYDFGIGPEDDLVAAFPNSPDLHSGVVEVRPQPDFSADAQILIEQAGPVPLHVQNMTIEVVVGGN